MQIQLFCILLHYHLTQFSLISDSTPSVMCMLEFMKRKITNSKSDLQTQWKLNWKGVAYMYM